MITITITSTEREEGKSVTGAIICNLLREYTRFHVELNDYGNRYKDALVKHLSKERQDIMRYEERDIRIEVNNR